MYVCVFEVYVCGFECCFVGCDVCGVCVNCGDGVVVVLFVYGVDFYEFGEVVCFCFC